MYKRVNTRDDERSARNTATTTNKQFTHKQLWSKEKEEQPDWLFICLFVYLFVFLCLFNCLFV